MYNSTIFNIILIHRIIIAIVLIVTITTTTPNSKYYKTLDNNSIEIQENLLKIIKELQEEVKAIYRHSS